VGWRLSHAGEGDTHRLSGTATAITPVAAVDVAARAKDGGFTGAVTLRGSLVAMAGGIGMSSPVGDAFALVHAGRAGVPVTLRNKLIGHTGLTGTVVVPRLKPYAPNQLGLDIEDLPLDAVFSSTRQTVVPAEGGGVFVSFAPAVPGGTALVFLTDPDGAEIPVSSVGRVVANGVEFLVGYDGQAYVEGLSDDNRVEIALPDGRVCRAEFPFSGLPGVPAMIDAVCIWI
jgi:outer membrane usher protein